MAILYWIDNCINICRISGARIYIVENWLCIYMYIAFQFSMNDNLYTYSGWSWAKFCGLYINLQHNVRFYNNVEWKRNTTHDRDVIAIYRTSISVHVIIRLLQFYSISFPHENYVGYKLQRRGVENCNCIKFFYILDTDSVNRVSRRSIAMWNCGSHLKTHVFFFSFSSSISFYVINIINIINIRGRGRKLFITSNQIVQASNPRRLSAVNSSLSVIVAKKF